MDASTEAADFVVKESLTLMVDSLKLVLKGTGTGAVRSLALLGAVMKSQHRTKGAVRLAAMLKSGVPLEVFTLPQDQLTQWHKHAKQYGILYTMIRSKDKDGQVDLVFRTEDAARVARIMERYHLAATPEASVTAEAQPEAQRETEQDQPKDEIENLIDNILAPDAPEQTHQQVMTDEEMERLFAAEEPPEPLRREGQQAEPAPPDLPENPTPALANEAPSWQRSEPSENRVQGSNEYQNRQTWTFARVQQEWPLTHGKEEFTPEQRAAIHQGFAHGLSPEQVERYAQPRYSPETMAILREATRPSVMEAIKRVRAQQQEEKAPVQPVPTPVAPEV